jgi:hypothetical protein
MSNFLIIKLIVQPVLLKRVRISMQLDADEKLLREHGGVCFSCVGLKVEILASPSN